jgi:hypothetical protein
MKDLSMLILASLLGTLLVALAVWLFGFEEAIIYSMGFVIGKHLLNDVNNLK